MLTEDQLLSISLTVNRIADEHEPPRGLAAQRELQHERRDVLTVGDDVACHVVAHESPTDGAGRAMIERRHRVEEVRHVSRASRRSLFERRHIRARVTDGDDPTARR